MRSVRSDGCRFSPYSCRFQLGFRGLFGSSCALDFPLFPVCSIFSHHTAWASLPPLPLHLPHFFLQATTQPPFGPPADSLGLWPTGNNLTYLTNNGRLPVHYGISLALLCTDRLHSQAQAPHLGLAELPVDLEIYTFYHFPEIPPRLIFYTDILNIPRHHNLFPRVECAIFKHALGKLSITRQCTASPTPEKLQTAGLESKIPQVISASLGSVHVLFQ